jgi:predicted DNA-binding transcriptional regulator AlpA
MTYCEDDRFLSLAEVARMVGATRRATRRWLEEAGVQPFMFGGSRNARLAFEANEVAAWIESCRANDESLEDGEGDRDDLDDDLEEADEGEEHEDADEDDDLEDDEDAEDSDEDLEEDDPDSEGEEDEDVDEDEDDLDACDVNPGRTKVY